LSWRSAPGLRVHERRGGGGGRRWQAGAGPAGALGAALAQGAPAGDAAAAPLHRRPPGRCHCRPAVRHKRRCDSFAVKSDDTNPASPCRKSTQVDISVRFEDAETRLVGRRPQLAQQVMYPAAESTVAVQVVFWQHVGCGSSCACCRAVGAAGDAPGVGADKGIRRHGGQAGHAAPAGARRRGLRGRRRDGAGAVTPKPPASLEKGRLNVASHLTAVAGHMRRSSFGREVVLAVKWSAVDSCGAGVLTQRVYANLQPVAVGIDNSDPANNGRKIRIMVAEGRNREARNFNPKTCKTYL